MSVFFWSNDVYAWFTQIIRHGFWCVPVWVQNPWSYKSTARPVQYDIHKNPAIRLWACGPWILPEVAITSADLDGKKAEMEQTLDKLWAEQNRLTTQSPETMRGEKLESYQKKVNDLNKRIRRYKVELNRFQRQVASFNNRIKRLQLKEKEKEQQSGL